MTLWSSRSWRSRTCVSMGLAFVLCFTTGVGARSDNSRPALPAQQEDQLTFNVDTVTMFFQITDTAAADFESFMGKVKEVLGKSDKPERKLQAASWKILVKLDAAEKGILTYIWVLDPVAKGVSYDLFKILSEGMPPDQVAEIYKKVGPNIKGISRSPSKIVGAPLGAD